tara:strand:- start:7608 stop:8468 length:861 start_codon:yes stop_codon:yes gene_type:complete
MNIVLTAFGKQGYFYAAYNFAFSIKHYDPTANILLIHDKGIKHLGGDLKYFDKLHEIDEYHTNPQGMFDPANVKLITYKIATKHFNKYLFLDVDNIALGSLQTFYDSIEQDFALDVEGKGGKDDKIPYCVWAENSDIWEQFKLDDNDTYYAVHSSWHFARKTKENTAMFKEAIRLNLETFKDRRLLKVKWGVSLPDELPLGGALARRGYDASFKNPIFYGDRFIPIAEMKEKYLILAMYGAGIGLTNVKRDYIEFYDRHMRDLFKAHGLNQTFKIGSIMRDKLINK